MAKLREEEGIAARALEFTILTAARTSEAIGARRSEVNAREKLWTVPADRMKADKEHRVPLSSRALEIFAAAGVDEEGFIFPGGRWHRPLSNMAMLALLKRMGRGDLTVRLMGEWEAYCAAIPKAGEVVEFGSASITK